MYRNHKDVPTVKLYTRFELRNFHSICTSGKPAISNDDQFILARELDAIGRSEYRGHNSRCKLQIPSIYIHLYMGLSISILFHSIIPLESCCGMRDACKRMHVIPARNVKWYGLPYVTLASIVWSHGSSFQVNTYNGFYWQGFTT